MTAQAGRQAGTRTHGSAGRPPPPSPTACPNALLCRAVLWGTTHLGPQSHLAALGLNAGSAQPSSRGCAEPSRASGCSSRSGTWSGGPERLSHPSRGTICVVQRLIHSVVCLGFVLIFFFPNHPLQVLGEGSISFFFFPAHWPIPKTNILEQACGGESVLIKAEET